ncbi:helix-turn-helix domain-containing protein [Mycobacterium ostraviense]|uniref:helix-turn-helix domain-containing protein n=1 Tax=Mycobacterium ostraviense TaxID=2738409 RepID=UPI001E329A09|nr:helix-turn-helix domain-containing protein [Mycobacterium ostraviense]UGT92935.1 helix-turn-helix domain-containing protein [Mycobacterium ostraviense]
MAPTSTVGRLPGDDRPPGVAAAAAAPGVPSSLSYPPESAAPREATGARGDATTGSSPAAGWAGRALLQPGMLVYAGLIGPTGRHAHHAVQVLLTTEPVDVVGDHGRVHRGTRLVIPANTAHRITSADGPGVIVFLDPATAPGRNAHSIGIAVWQQPNLLPGPIDDGDLPAVARAVAGAFHTAGCTGDQLRHRAVTDALDLLTQLAPEGPVRTADIAVRIGISTTRLTHLFTAEVGLPLRRYVLWLRLMMALRAVAAGDDLTTAAHAAGFADSAHLTRTSRAMFGLAPSSLQRHVHIDVSLE